MDRRKVELFIKRVFDLIFSFLVVSVFLPLILIIGFLIKLDSKGGVFYLQDRLGENEKTFKIIKFRTMVANAEKIGARLRVEKNDPRITKIGAFLRKTSLDEIPQFFNVLKGDMSVVGPRPALVSNLKKYSPEQKRRLLMKPGITGLAQIKGRAALSWPERIEYDLKYIENYSLKMDFIIILKTFSCIFKPRNIYRDKAGWKE